MYLATNLRSEALLLGAGDRALSAAMLADAAFAGALRVVDHGLGLRTVIPGAAPDPLLPDSLRLVAWEAARVGRTTPESWVDHAQDSAPDAIAAELDAWWGSNTTPAAIARSDARTAVEAAIAGDGDVAANALAALLWRSEDLEGVRGRPTTRMEARRLSLALLGLPAAPTAFIAASSRHPDSMPPASLASR